MAGDAQIETATADFLDPSLYEQPSASSLPRLTQGSLLAPLSRAFDLAEGRAPGHAQRVAYVGVYLGRELRLSRQDLEHVFFACLLHDAGMAAATGGRKTRHHQGGTAEGPDWSEIIQLVGFHTEAGARIVTELGLAQEVADAVARHHECWDAAEKTPSIVARIVAAADRVESLMDSKTSPLQMRRRGPRLIREMANAELDPDIAERMAVAITRDDFWLGFHDNDLGSVIAPTMFGRRLDTGRTHAVLAVLSDVVDQRNGKERGRGRRVADLARKLALTCDLSERRADMVKAAALVQDIGTLGVPAAYLRKPDILSINEMSEVQLHPTYARDILSEIPGFGAAAWWVGCHHERVDGKGYPGMLEGDEVPIEAQIIGICDMFDALTSDRPFRPALSRPEAGNVLRGLAGARFTPYVFDRFEAVVGSFDD
ncbi:MAG: HD domain-containing protein [Dehalococcoidia bacterium]